METMETIIINAITVTRVQIIGTNQINGGNMKLAGMYLPAFIYL
jgi:hypothetical protein